MQVVCDSGPLVAALHETQDRLRYRRAVERTLVLDLDDRVPVLEEQVLAPAERLVGRGRVLAPVGQAWPTGELQRLPLPERGGERVEDCSQKLSVFLAERRPQP